MTRFLAGVGLVVLLLLSGMASAAERIRAYDATIAVAADGALTVTERIRATVEGDRIQRGIYRDFPLLMQDAEGRTHRVGFTLLSVRRDGKEEPSRTEAIDGGIRIYTGEKDVILRHGEHVFELTYETDRQIRFFNSYDELYWNVTGNGWSFPIDAASARVTLPKDVRPLALAAYTGPQGSTARDARGEETADGAVFRTTRPLGAEEGLTILVKLPKGAVAAPDASQERLWWMRDNLALLIATPGLMLVGVYYLFVWFRAGRDPEGGVVVPRWEPPAGLSPALVNYVDNRGFADGGWTALSAAALNLAVAGELVLEDFKSSLTLRRAEGGAAAGAEEKGGPWQVARRAASRPASGAAVGEASLIAAVDQAGGTLVIDKANGPAVQKLGTAFRTAIESEHRGKYYRQNWGLILIGLGLSAITLALIVLFGHLSEDGIGIVIIPVFAAVFVTIMLGGLVKSVRRRASLARRILSVVVLAIFAFVALTIFGGLFSMIALEAIETHQLPLLLCVGGIVLINGLFFFLMGAPTPLGAKLSAEIAGLRQYLTLAEKERMNMAGAPTMSPTHYETLLPYAVALGVEEPWSRTFETWLATAAAGAAAYSPVWYHGQGFDGGFAGRMGGFAGSMASTMQSSLPPPPKSSSSGFSSGGGFSGGGGGGGGGGGW
ncbi:DUF2207 domain-containing protein [Rhizobium sp. YIM 134829]|uniref:DUF2207 domain-containing protein n=1 Tax=Rhizobium sp. YIM 134829 TaxID=3390453 RepID=UPI00397AE100